MPFPNHYRLQFGGTLRGDIWSCNINFTSGLQQLTNAQQTVFAESSENRIKYWMSAASNGPWSTAAVLTYTKFNRIGPTGAYFDQGNTNVAFNDPPTAGTVAPTHQNDTALVFTWTTAFARGPASTGRIYIPCPVATLVPATGRLSVATCQAYAQSASNFLNLMNADISALGEPGYAVVASQLGVAGTLNKIQGVKVGDVLDVQRRRRNALVETYTTSSVPIV